MKQTLALARFIARTTYFSPTTNILLAVLTPVLVFLFYTKDLDRQDVLLAMFVFSLTASFLRRLKGGNRQEWNQTNQNPVDGNLRLLPVTKAILFRGGFLALLGYSVVVQAALSIVLFRCSFLPTFLQPEYRPMVEKVITKYGDTLTKVFTYSVDRERGVTAKLEKIIAPSMAFDGLLRHRYWPAMVCLFFVLLSLADGVRHLRAAHGDPPPGNACVQNGILMVVQTAVGIFILADILLPTPVIRHMAVKATGFAPVLYVFIAALVTTLILDRNLLPTGKRA